MNGDLTFLHGSHLAHCTATVDKHFNGYHSLQLMTRGGVELFYDQQRHAMEAGIWFWRCYPGPHIRFHTAVPGQSWEHRYVAFTGPRVTQWEAMGLLMVEPQAVAQAGPAEDERQRFTALFDRLLDHLRDTDRWGRLLAVNLLEQILLELAQRRTWQPDPPPAWLSAVMQALESFDGPEPDYAALAAAHHMSLSSLRRRFREATGQPLHRYRLQCRAAAACRLLGDTDLRLKEIADQLGYQDVFYFSKQFTQTFAISPGAYRKSRQR